MGKQIVKQPNGLYALWSTVVDDFILVDATPDEIIEDFLSLKKVEVTNFVWQAVTDLENGKKPYYQFTKTFDECVEIVRENHGNDAESLKMLGVSQ